LQVIQDFPKKGGKPDFTQNISQNELDIGFLSNNDNEDLYNINNIDKPIDIQNIEEDSRPFQERLKRNDIVLYPFDEPSEYNPPNRNDFIVHGSHRHWRTGVFTTNVLFTVPEIFKAN
jgi:hypothetical protein